MNLQTQVEKLGGREVFEPIDFSKLRQIFSPILLEINKISPKVITVAGTNGKGQTAQFITNLIGSKSKSMTWTSPHLIAYEERFKLNGEMISSSSLKKSLNAFSSLFSDNIVGLSFYEISFWLFCHQILINRPEVIVLEVGLGGRLDAVNLFNADILCLTSISRDHTEFLGNKFRQILKEKLALLRENTNLIYSVRTHYLKKLVDDYCIEAGAKGVSFIDPCLGSNQNFQKRNWAIAKKCMEYLFGGKPRLIDPFSQQSFGRGAILKIGRSNVTYYNSHNIDGHRELVNSINQSSYDKVMLFFPKREKSEIRGIYNLYSEVFKEKVIVCYSETVFKIAKKEELTFLGVEACDFSLRKIKEGAPMNILLVGSNYISILIRSELVG